MHGVKGDWTGRVTRTERNPESENKSEKEKYGVKKGKRKTHKNPFC